MRSHFAHPAALLLLLLLPGVLAILAYGDRRRRLTMRFFEARSGAHRPKLRRTLLLLGMATLIFAASGPLGTALPARTENAGDIVFLLDVSRSMLSADVVPNRLVQAKSVVARIVASLRGERTALVTFAGATSVDCPLTIDHEYFRAALSQASPDSVARGGTLIGGAIRFSLQFAFDNVSRSRKQIILLTDGGDQESDSGLAAAEAAKRGFDLLVIGLGDPDGSAAVPVSELDPTPVIYNGAPVRTTLDVDSLRAIAAAGSGAYLTAGQDLPGDAEIYSRFLASAPGRPGPMPSVNLFPWLILLAVLLFAGEIIL